MTILAIALLGRKDEPTDAVEEYCRYLAAALQTHRIQMEIRRVPWEIHGWSGALNALSSQAAQWHGTWVLLQYTALAWSSRGFPHKVIRALKILKAAGARVGIVFHDVEPYSGTRLIDSVRRFVQVRTMRRALALADLAIFTVPPEKLSWPRGLPPQTAFIPVGPNLPIPEPPPAHSPQNSVSTIGVFSITGGESGAQETREILGAVRYASQKLGKLRLAVFGRHAELRQADLCAGLRELPVELSVEGVLAEQQVVERLRSCDVLLFVRGGISTRRGSAIAGIACGVPMIAYAGPETAWPILDAGVILIPPHDPAELNNTLLRVLSDSDLRLRMRRCNFTIYSEHFSWPAIATRFAALLLAK